MPRIGAARVVAGLPNKPRTIVVPFAASGNIDVVAREVASRLTAPLRQGVVV